MLRQANNYRSCVLGMIIFGGCNTVPGPPAPPTPLPQGVFTGTATCDLRTTSPSGEQMIEENTQTVTFEINERGIPLVLGDEVRVGRTVELGGIQGTYTRIEATDTGIVIHSRLGGSLNGVSVSGTGIATMNSITAEEIEYDVTLTYLDSAGFAYNTGCTFILIQ